ncbi:hypothetical protein EXIGLDRAFT_701288 [Exidia glandulosa HHB12029]|uniref:AB hydrolase-1 domain-containing protein n=1 Tax=Exidia glandulosa HHB12029 TaxID=1314781 RepID=A0A165D0G6_EXIGL|nr:hypothetical protein EXIGLDRAFT_701288 [Exidia glandulosa HHB12029]
MFALPVAATVVAALAGFAVGYPTPVCTNSFVTVTASATNYDLSNGTLPPAATVPVSGTYSIQLRYCKPTLPVPSRANSLQVLVHGLTYNTNYWDIPYKPDTYSYARWAAFNGYATLNMARLGYGNSSHPDPVTVVQDPMDTAIVTKIVELARAGGIPGAGKSFSKIIYAGHSYGSLILNGIMAATPSLVNAAVLSGYSHEVGTGVPTIIAGMAPAATVDPARFGSLPPGYMTTINSTTRAAAFYGPTGSYESGALAYDESTKDTATLGEFITFPATLVPAPSFTGDVLTINGDHDLVFCTTTDCANGSAGSSYYPAANSVEYIVIPVTGHCLNFHHTAPLTYLKIQQWLNAHGY